MTLNELGFHKCAGVQKDWYKLVKPHTLDLLNIRSAREAKDLYKLDRKLPAGFEELADTGRGPMSTLAYSGEDGISKSTTGLLNNVIDHLNRNDRMGARNKASRYFEKNKPTGRRWNDGLK